MGPLPPPPPPPPPPRPRSSGATPSVRCTATRSACRAAGPGSPPSCSPNPPPAAAAPGGKVVFHVGSGTVAAHGEVSDALARLRELPHVTGAGPLVTSADGATASTDVTFDKNVRALGHPYAEQREGAVEPARDAGVGVGYGGDLVNVVRAPANDLASELVL